MACNRRQGKVFFIFMNVSKTVVINLGNVVLYEVILLTEELAGFYTSFPSQF